MIRFIVSLSSRELTYPCSQGMFEDDFPFPKDMLLPGGYPLLMSVCLISISSWLDGLGFDRQFEH